MLSRALKRAALTAVVAIGLSGPFARSADEHASLPPAGANGFIPLFNGHDLSGWEGLEGFWSVKDGAIDGHETKESSKQTFLVYKNSNFGDFELRYKFKFVSEDGNSGMQFRSKVIEPATFRAGGYQADCDAGDQFTGIIYDEAGVAGGRGIMSNRGERTHWDSNNQRHNEKLPESNAELKKIIKAHDWNDVDLTVHGNHIVYKINGHTTTELIDDSPKALHDGILAIQLHQGFTMEIQFKDIEIKPLK